MQIVITESQFKLLSEQLDTTQFKKASEFVASQWYWDHIREEEGLRCKAYKNKGEKNFTIGYGHSSEDVKEGDVLGDGKNCKGEADDLLYQDSTEHADKLRKIFTEEWESQEIYLSITQGMFDALLSLSYNGGAGGLRRSDVLAILKTIGDDKGVYKSAAETIKTYRVSMPGHKVRREKEYERFIEGL
tara:strand:+ start:861 stop:1424 length:564 start_codon:yes stop_codon:yes gene_type:complete